jgi:hypothetical protein
MPANDSNDDADRDYLALIEAQRRSNYQTSVRASNTPDYYNTLLQARYNVMTNEGPPLISFPRSKRRSMQKMEEVEDE